MSSTRRLVTIRLLVFSTVLASGAVSVSAADGAAAPRSEAAEEFVQSNLGRIQTLIDDSSLVGARREAALASLLGSFIAFAPVSNFVLGRFAGAMRANHALQAEWESTFRAYAIANYEVRLERFRGRAHRVTGSMIRSPDWDVVVFSELRGAGDQPMRLSWRVLRRGGQWQVFDLSVRLEAGEIWLAQQQQAEFLSILDRNHGDLPALAARVRGVTAHIRSPS